MTPTGELGHERMATTDRTGHQSLRALGYFYA